MNSLEEVRQRITDLDRQIFDQINQLEAAD